MKIQYDLPTHATHADVRTVTIDAAGCLLRLDVMPVTTSVNYSIRPAGGGSNVGGIALTTGVPILTYIHMYDRHSQKYVNL